MSNIITIKNQQLWQSLMAHELKQELSEEQLSSVMLFKARCDQHNWTFDCVCDSESIVILAA